MFNWKRTGEQALLQEVWINGAAFLEFPALQKIEGITHLFTTRIGGVSEGDLFSMNLSYNRGDDPENVTENFSRVAKAMNRSKEDFVLSCQTHTTNIRVVTKEDAGKGVVCGLDYSDTDGLVTDVKGIILGTFFADCVPLYFVDPKRNVIGLAHSGWKGTIDRMGKCMVETLTKEYGSDPADLICAIGPSICRNCYEISEELADRFGNTFSEYKDRILAKGRYITETAEQKYQLDLWETNRIILEDAGVLPEHISVTDICTCCNPDHLFSHRASHGKRGNLGAFLSIN